MRLPLPWKRGARPIEPPRRFNLKRAELETAKEILAEVFHVRPAEVEQMIQQRLEERSQAAAQGPIPEGELWPEAFCLEENSSWAAPSGA